MIYMINMHQYTHHIQLPVVLYWETQSFGISPARLDASIMLINILQGAGLKHRRKPNATSMYVRLVHITCPTEYTWNWGELIYWDEAPRVSPAFPSPGPSLRPHHGSTWPTSNDSETARFPLRHGCLEHRKVKPWKIKKWGNKGGSRWFQHFHQKWVLIRSGTKHGRLMNIYYMTSIKMTTSVAPNHLPSENNYVKSTPFWVAYRSSSKHGFKKHGQQLLVHLSTILSTIDHHSKLHMFTQNLSQYSSIHVYHGLPIKFPNIPILLTNSDSTILWTIRIQAFVYEPFIYWPCVDHSIFNQ